jgi:diguanylate cyclase (GGDEF)-like protein
MAEPGANGGGSPARLFLIFACLSLLPVAGLGALLVHGYRSDARDQALDIGRAQAALIVEMAVDPALSGTADLGQGISGRQEQLLRRATELAIYHGTVVHLRVRGYDGAVVFSDDGRTDTSLDVGDPAFAGAAAGRTEVDVVSAPQRPGGAVIRVLLPIVATTTGQAGGVLEVHLPYGAIAEDLHQQQRRTYATLAAGLGALYVLLVLISWSTTRRLHRFAAQRERDALTDSLTGLPNRAAFQRQGERLVARKQDLAVVLVDLDRFKEVNDSLGHHVGDALLVGVAHRLREAVRPGDVVARLGGDEFGLLLADVRDPIAVGRVLGAVRTLVIADLMVEGVRVRVGASFGAALHPAHGDTVGDLLRHADHAMYRAKRQDGGGVAVYPGSGHPRVVTQPRRP